MKRVKIKNDIVASIEAKLLKRLRARGAAPRVDLARDLSLAPSTVGIYVDRLLDDGYLLEGEKSIVERGRPATLLTLNPDGGRFVGVDIEARNILAVAVDFSQHPIRRVHRRLRGNESRDAVVARAEEAIREVMAGDERQVLGIGVGVPGVVDPHRGLAVHYEYIRGWRDVQLREELERTFGTSVFLENNIRSMALAELWFGLGRDETDFICLGVRSGIAAGIVIGGELFRGHDNLAGEIGGWPVAASALGADESSTKSDERAWERLEDIASVRVVAERMAASETGGASPSTRSVAARLAQWSVAVNQRDPRIVAELERVAAALGLVISQLNLAFNPSKVVVAGPLTEFGRPLVEAIERTVRRFSPELHSAVPEVACSELGEYSGALGAAALAVHEWKPAR